MYIIWSWMWNLRISKKRNAYSRATKILILGYLFPFWRTCQFDPDVANGNKLIEPTTDQLYLDLANFGKKLPTTLVCPKIRRTSKICLTFSMIFHCDIINKHWISANWRVTWTYSDHFWKGNVLTFQSWYAVVME